MPLDARPSPEPLPWFVGWPLAALAGVLLACSFAPFSLWPLAFASVALLGWVVHRARAIGAAALLGAVFGVALNGIALAWQSQIAVESYAGLVAVEVPFTAALAAALRAASGLRGEALLAAGLWTAVEFVQQRWPFGGFAWLRLGYTQIESPLAGWYPFVGAAGVSTVVVLLAYAALLVAERPGRRRALAAALAWASACGLGVLGGLLPGAPADAPRVHVGWVQGGAPGGGVYGIGPAGTMGKNHAAETGRLLARVAAGQEPRPDFLVWPENGTDMDPFLDVATNQTLADTVAAAGVPLLVTVPVEGPKADERATSALWWTNAGVAARYDKRNLVPFGEFVPFRDQLLPLVPMLRYVGAQTIPGTTPGALHVTDAAGRPLVVGVAICYEVAFPATVWDAAEHGGEVMIVQSSNAMFSGTPQLTQQFDITRVRAAEMRREILVDTTSGQSGFVDDHGRVVSLAPQQAAASGVVALARSTHRTPVMLGGWVAEPLAALAGLVALVVGVVRRRGTSTDPGDESDDQRDGQ